MSNQPALAVDSRLPEPITTPPARLSTLDRWLPAWIGLAMIAGLVLGRFVPLVGDALETVQVGGISVPIALGLLVMMYPVLAKVRYDRVGAVTGDKRLLVSSLVLNWVVGPALMFALAWLLLPDLPEYRTGLIIVGLARCIAMVVIWNDLACGDRDAAAVLVAFNSVFQVVAFSVLGYFYLTVLPGWLGLDTQGLDVSMGQIALNVLVFLGIPLVAGFASRWIGERRRGRDWYESVFVPRVGPWALYGLLFTIVLLFALQGDAVTGNPLDVVRIAVPLLAYFAIMWSVGMVAGRSLGLGYARSTTLAFTAAGNNFELAIAVAIGTFGAASGQALAGVVGPLIEVPVLVGLVYVLAAGSPAVWLRSEESRVTSRRTLQPPRVRRRAGDERTRRRPRRPDPQGPGRSAPPARRCRSSRPRPPARRASATSASSPMCPSRPCPTTSRCSRTSAWSPPSGAARGSTTGSARSTPAWSGPCWSRSHRPR